MHRNNAKKVILITGASSGFGLLTAARLAACGHFVYATMRDTRRQQPLLDKVAISGGQVLVRTLDVTKSETITKVVDEINQHHNHIDVVINNAGLAFGGFFEDLTDEEIRIQMDVNFFGVQNVCREVIPLMRKHHKGLIINISSIAGQTATPALGAYNASKWALEGFSESLFYELNQFGINVVLVEPGSYPTNIFKENTHYAKNYNNPQSPYYPFSQRLKEFVDQHVRSSKRNPERIAVLIEHIIQCRTPKLRYVSDFSSWVRIVIGKTISPKIYNYIFRKVIYGK